MLICSYVWLRGQRRVGLHMILVLILVLVLVVSLLLVRMLLIRCVVFMRLNFQLGLLFMMCRGISKWERRVRQVSRARQCSSVRLFSSARCLCSIRDPLSR